MAAGAATKTGVIGYVVPFPIPEVIRHANAFALGAQATHPGAKVKLVWTKSWFDMAKEKKAAESLAAAGADVIGQNVDSPAAGQFAQSKGLPWVGYDSNAKKFAPTSWLTAAVYNWGPYYLKQVKGAMNGTWKTGSYYGSMKRRLHRDRPVRAEGLGQDEGRDRREEEGDHRRDVLRVPGPDLRPGGQAQGPEGEEDDPGRDPLGRLARQGNRRQPEGLMDSAVVGAGATGAHPPRSRPQP